MHAFFWGWMLLCSFMWQEFTGREEDNHVRRPVYRAKVPHSWVRLDPSGSIEDTTKPNISFQIDEKVQLTVHSFPSMRIPPRAQVERWLGQAHGDVHEVSHGGFVGLCLRAPTLLAWSLQLDFEHDQILRLLASSKAEEAHFEQMRADYTIKAVGPEALIEKHREEIELFAHSFELIQEIPARS